MSAYLLILTILRGNTGPPSGYLQYIPFSEGVSSIVISSDHYDLIGETWQPVFFTNPTTPIVFADFNALWAAVSAVSEFNDSNVKGVDGKWIALYAESVAPSATAFNNLTESEFNNLTEPEFNALT